ncbi:MAG: hypothetical protein C0597_11620 [Marinilabiliales bacterium]|nr:MAG: hypothetical protein C0597_11620 [Marinilabiliales bacterium]
MMNLSFINFIESSVMLAFLYLFYELVLKKETFFKMNRLYLITTLLFAVTIPFLNLKVNFFTGFESNSDLIHKLSGFRQSYYNLNAVIVYADKGKFTWNSFSDYLSLVYITGVFISIAFFLFGLGRIIILILKNQSKALGKYKIVETSESIFPFSLFKWIIINPDKYSSEDIKQIIAHEKMHAFQLHSIDLILIEVLVILFWFNPFIYWYRKSIREVHEYLADQAVVENGFDQIDYQKLLLNQVTGNRFIGLTSRFSYSLSKNRLKMLTMMKSKNISKIKIALAIPFITAFVLFFTNCEKQKSETDDLKETKDKTGLVIIDDLKSEEEVFTDADIMPKFEGNDPDEFRYFIQKNVKYPKAAQEKGAEGKVFVKFTVGSDGEVKDIKVLRGVDEYLDQEALRVVKSSPKWTPAIKDNKAVAVQFTFPITFKLS